MTDRTAISLNASVLEVYAHKHGVDRSAFLADGTMSLIYDAAYRVEVRPHVAGRLVLQSVLMDVSPFSIDRREEFLVRMLRLAASTVRDFASGLVLDAAQSRLLLQQSVDASFDLPGLEVDLADFVNVLAFWRGILQEESRWLLK